MWLKAWWDRMPLLLWCISVAKDLLQIWTNRSRSMSEPGPLVRQKLSLPSLPEFPWKVTPQLFMASKVEERRGNQWKGEEEMINSWMELTKELFQFKLSQVLYCGLQWKKLCTKIPWILPVMFSQKYCFNKVEWEGKMSHRECAIYTGGKVGNKKRCQYKWLKKIWSWTSQQSACLLSLLGKISPTSRHFHSR